jgi:uncharacterized protein with ParB-like and HNH nuclease domain
MNKAGKDIVQPEEFSVENVFKGTEYVVPIYQRNYAWEKREIEQLLDDINDAEGKYYLGSLVVNHLEPNVYEVIDGQQRLTTLFLLLSFLNDPSVNKRSLRFEARENSNKTLQDIDSIKDEEKELENEPWYSEEIVKGYKIIREYFEIHTGNDYRDTFVGKLKNITIIRTQVPEKIDLNHYFEIMNTRGEQLELHEIVKSYIIGAMENTRDQQIAAVIWDACSQMDRYVQMGFKKERREQLFGSNWGNFLCKDFSQLRAKFADEGKSGEGNLKLMDILNMQSYEKKPEEDSEEEENERFESVISFPNFILQVNEAMSYSETEDDGGLDDKRFMDVLSRHWENNENALDFIFHLLKFRFLFDKYIIKREYARDYKTDGKWSLQRLEMYEYSSRKKSSSKKPLYKGTFGPDDDRNNRLRMLQSCLRITYTSPKTMHWISNVLAALEEDEKTDMIGLLENYCCAKLKAADYKNRMGFSIDRIVFTYLDYVLYRDDKSSKFQNFQFQFRTSIEHFYPQHPMNGEKWEDHILNSFGNLALITVSANSRFSNMLPISKAENYADIIEQSPKLMKMKELLLENNRVWNPAMVEKHNTEMMQILEDEIASHDNKGD